MNLQVFRQFVFEEHQRLGMFCIEHEKRVDEITAVMHRHGFALVLDNGTNAIYTRKV